MKTTHYKHIIPTDSPKLPFCRAHPVRAINFGTFCLNVFCARLTTSVACRFSAPEYQSKKKRPQKRGLCDAAQAPLPVWDMKNIRWNWHWYALMISTYVHNEKKHPNVQKKLPCRFSHMAFFGQTILDQPDSKKHGEHSIYSIQGTPRWCIVWYSWPDSKWSISSTTPGLGKKEMRGFIAYIYPVIHTHVCVCVFEGANKCIIDVQMYM